MAQSNWSIAASDGRSVTFKLVLDNITAEVKEQVEAAGEGDSDDQDGLLGPLQGRIEVAKTYSLADLNDEHSYHLGLKLEFANKGDASQRLAFRQHGPNSIVNESWWTS